MVTVPNRYPVYISEIRDALGGANDLGWYRGRQYWNAAGNAVTISGNAAMSEFPGLTNVAPEQASALVCGASGQTVGYNGQSGFSFGSLSPNTYKGGTIVSITVNASSQLLSITFAGYLPQNQFGTFKESGLTFSSANASFSQFEFNGQFSNWDFANSGLSWVNGQSRTVYFGG